MLICFFESDGIVQKEFNPPGQTVNKVFYCDVLRRLRENMKRKHPEMLHMNDWVLHHDNAQPHTSYIVQEFLAKNKIDYAITSLLPYKERCYRFTFNID
jgi:hypothetical protein